MMAGTAKENVSFLSRASSWLLYSLPFFAATVLNGIITNLGYMVDSTSVTKRIILFVVFSSVMSMSLGILTEKTEKEYRGSAILLCVLALISAGLSCVPNPNTSYEVYTSGILFFSSLILLSFADKCIYLCLLSALLNIYLCFKMQLGLFFALPVFCILCFGMVEDYSAVLFLPYLKKKDNKSKKKRRKKEEQKNTDIKTVIKNFVPLFAGIVSAVFGAVLILANIKDWILYKPFVKTGTVQKIFLLVFFVCVGAVWVCSVMLKRKADNSKKALPFTPTAMIAVLIFNLLVLFLLGYRYSVEIVFLPFTVQIMAAAFLVSRNDTDTVKAVDFLMKFIRKHFLWAALLIIVLIRITVATTDYYALGFLFSF